MAGVISAVAVVVGTATSIYTASEAKKAKREAAEVARMESEFEANRQRKATERLIKQQRASYAASGVTMEGTPYEVMSLTEIEAEEEYNQILMLGGMRSRAYYKEGQQMFSQGLGQGATTLLTGTAETWDYYD